MLLLLAALATAAPQGSEDPPADRLIHAVLPARSCVLASDGTRFYRAGLIEKTWRPIPAPKEMSSPGTFAAAPGCAKPVLFFPERIESGWVLDDQTTGAGHALSREEAWKQGAKGPHGLFGATSNGDDWELLNGDFDFWSVVGVGDGLLYSAATPREADKRINLVLVSKDGGRTWTDMTHNAMNLGVGRYESMIPDPDHPRQVCLRFQGMRGYIVHAPDEQFHWHSTMEDGWMLRHPEIYESLAGGFSYSAIENISDYALPATFGNYFRYPFDGRLSIQAFDLDLDRTSYVYPAKGPKEVAVTVRCRRTDHAAAFMDLPGSTNFWSVCVTDPRGRSFPMRTIAEMQLDGGQDGVEQVYARSTGMFSTLLREGRSYRRTVDLGRLYDLSAPGTYTVRLRYGCPFVTGAGRARWRGSFSSEPVTVRITGP